jgi:plastocyanin
MRPTLLRFFFPALFLLSLNASATIHVVEAFNFFYSPANLTVDPGDTIRFQWVEGNHPTRSTTGPWTTEVSFPLTVNPGEQTFDLVLTAPGVYNYECIFHIALGMIGSITVVGDPIPTCSTAEAPTGQSHTTLSNRVQLNWTPQTGAVACQVQGKQLPSGPQPSVNVSGAVINTTNVPFSIAGSGTTWTWRVRCACSLSPLQIGLFSPYGDTFSIPAAREGQLLSQEFSAYPNPSSGWFSLRFEVEGQDELQLQVFDVSGRLRHQERVATTLGSNTREMDLQGLETGLYFIKLEGFAPISVELLH